MDKPQDLDSRLAALEERLAELEDRDAIRSLIASYGPLADSGDAKGLAALWTEDGTYEVDGYGVNTGRAAIEALITGPVHQQLLREGCTHALTPVRIELAGASAVAVGYSCVFRRRDAGFEVWRVSANRWELRKERGRWLVERRINRLLDGNEAARVLLGIEGP